MNNQLSSITRFDSAVTPTAGVAGTTAITGSTIDSANAEGVLFLVRMGAITSGAVTSLKVQHSDTTTSGDFVDVAGTAQTIADTADDQTFVVDINKPAKRYVRVIVSRATQNAVVASAEALVYGLRSLPFSQPAGTNVESFGTPASGTA
jgi:hypothetical protein